MKGPLPATIWYGRCKLALRWRTSEPRTPSILTVWGWLPTAKQRGAPKQGVNKARQSVIGAHVQKLLAKEKRPRRHRGGAGTSEFSTIWFNCWPSYRRSKDHRGSSGHTWAKLGVPLTARTIWGDFPLWDGRYAVSLEPRDDGHEPTFGTTP